jgi:hypothetical protein
MATLALSLAGQFVGGALGGPIGATVGRALGALAGSAIDGALFAEPKVAKAGADIRLQGSSEGAPIPKLYGWHRLSGNVIWAAQFEKLPAEQRGAKATSSAPEAEDPGVAASFAIGLCEGVVSRLGRVWADGQLLDTAGLTLRFYRGTETQRADSLIEAKQGADAPAYRGLCYLVFERLPLKQFGNRIPSISVELCRAAGELEPAIKAVTLIPGATEFGYDPSPRVRLGRPGVTLNENAHQARDMSDWTLSLDELTALCPNLEHVALVVAWFGSDLRAANCAVEPKVEAASRSVVGAAWQVAGISRGTAKVMSTHAGGPAYGGTPSDASVRAAIADLKRRGIKVTLYPILLMDIAEGNAMGQPAYPWRGRIAGSSGAEIATFAAKYRSFILHYADLAVAAGGVDAFLIGSELRGLTFSRAASYSFPFVDALVSLAGEVRAKLGGGTKLTYAADWSEYSGWQDGSGAKIFHLDPLWASANIDAIGIDNYLPLADWRGDGEGPDAGEAGPYDLDYLKRNIEGGEGFDWFYASEADRLAGARTPIDDAVYGEPWVWRTKDITAFWSKAHYNRPGGVRSAVSTAWVPKSKPVWFTELGCGAVDKGANQPNVFTDPKSGEDAKPYFSNGAADPLAQRQALRAVLSYWDDPGRNPAAPGGGRMLARTYLWTWDARPFPAFPTLKSVWRDGDNHRTGHWLTGRLGGMASDELARAVAVDFGVPLDRVAAELPFLHGYVVEVPMTAREALAPLLAATGLDLHDTPEGLVVGRAGAGTALGLGELVAEDGPLVTRRRPDPGEAVGQVALSYVDRTRSYLSGAVTAIAPGAGMLEAVNAGLVLDVGGARSVAERLLLARRGIADSAEFTLPPSMAAIEVGDAVVLGADSLAVTTIRDGLARRISARAIAPKLVVTSFDDRPGDAGEAPPALSLPVAVFAHLPPAVDDISRSRLATAAFADPWPGSVTVTAEATGTPLAALGSVAGIGEVTAPFGPGGMFTWDGVNALEVALPAGHPASRDDDEVLAGLNRVAVQSDTGRWEIVGFATADLIAPQTYRLSRLLRGQGGTDHAIGACSKGNAVVLLEGGVVLLPVSAAWLDTTLTVRFFAGARDAVGQVADVALDLAPLLPLAPVHLKGVRVAGGEVTLSWVRRSRADSDSWAGDDAPPDVVPEGWRVVIFNGATAVRTLDPASAALTYTAAQQTADFGALPARFDFSVALKSPLYGPGHAARGKFIA